MAERGHIEEPLRSRAREADAAHGQPLDLASVWRDLVNGESRVSDCFHSEERSYVLLEPCSNPLDQAPKAQAGKIRILESILLEGAQKSIAIDLGLSPSTVAGALKKCLESIGLPCTTSRIPPLLVGAAYASQAAGDARWGRVSRVLDGGCEFRVVSVARPETELARVLTKAQYEVVRLLIEGKSHLEIAGLRQRSTRTIANQLGAAFRKLGVSGRSELIRRLIVGPLLHARAEASAPRTARLSASSPPLSSASWGNEPPLTVRRYRARARRAVAGASL